MRTMWRLELPVMGLGGLLTAALLLACSGSQQSAERPGYGGIEGETKLREPENDGRRCPADENLVQESLDTSGDNVADVRKVYRVEGAGAEARKVLVCREMDLNHDGRKDIFRFYNEDGRPLREMMDGDFDGTVDGVSLFEEGRVVQQEMDRNNDGRTDETRHFVQGNLLRVERDDNNDGRIDVWEHWADGDLLRIGYDVNADEVADFWHRAPPRAGEERPEAPQEPPEEEPAPTGD